tara:strand:+ start:194 stop:430 length:237 start_codon:yes stop_codon:yes gene_type:complete
MILDTWKQTHLYKTYTVTNSDITNHFTNVEEFKEVVRKLCDNESVTSQEQTKYNNLVSSLTADSESTKVYEQPATLMD